MNILRARSASNKMELPQGSMVIIDNIKLLKPQAFSCVAVDLLSGEAVELRYAALQQFFEEWELCDKIEGLERLERDESNFYME